MAEPRPAVDPALSSAKQIPPGPTSAVSGASFDLNHPPKAQLRMSTVIEGKPPTWQDKTDAFFKAYVFPPLRWFFVKILGTSGGFVGRAILWIYGVDPVSGYATASSSDAFRTILKAIISMVVFTIFLNLTTEIIPPWLQAMACSGYLMVSHAMQHFLTPASPDSAVIAATTTPLATTTTTTA